MNALAIRMTTLVPVLLIAASLATIAAAVASNDMLTAAAVDHTSFIEAGRKAP